MVAYKDSSVDIETKYTVEVVDDKKDWDYICNGVFNHGEPWERYKKHVFSSLDKAMSLYLALSFSDKVYDIKLFEQIVLNGEIIRESYLELDSSLLYSIRGQINKDMCDQLYRLKDRAAEQEAMLHKHDDFLRKYPHVNDGFKRFLEIS